MRSAIVPMSSGSSHSIYHSGYIITHTPLFRKAPRIIYSFYSYCPVESPEAPEVSVEAGGVTDGAGVVDGSVVGEVAGVVGDVETSGVVVEVEFAGVVGTVGVVTVVVVDAVDVAVPTSDAVVEAVEVEVVVEAEPESVEIVGVVVDVVDVGVDDGVEVVGVDGAGVIVVSGVVSGVTIYVGDVDEARAHVPRVFANWPFNKRTQYMYPVA